MLKRKELNSKKYKYDTLLLSWIFVIGVAAHFFVGDFSKALGIYPDEIRYYEIARSLFEGRGLIIRGVETNFQKIAYAVVLMPFFAIDNAVLRVKMITLFNSVLMMLSIIPTWYIGKELNLNRTTKYILVLLVVIWPDLMMSATFMAENLYWPVTLLFVYLWIKNERKKSKWYAALCGMLCYLGYLTKEIFLAFFLAYVVFELIYPIFMWLIEEDGEKKLWEFYHKNCFECLIIFIVIFALCHVILKSTFFSGMGNSYNQQGIEAILNPYNFTYMIYAFLYYLAAILVASFVVPISFPIIFFDKLSDMARKLYIYVVFLAGIEAAIIAYTISVREDLGCVMPRLHFRYLGPCFILLFLVFACLLEKLDVEDLKKRRRFLIEILMTNSVIVFAVFKGITEKSVVVDEYVLEWYRCLSSMFSNLQLPEGSGIIIYLGPIVANIILAICIIMFIVLLLKKKGVILYLLVFLTVVCAVSNYSAYCRIYDTYKIDDKAIKEVVAIDNFLKQLDANINVLYLTNENGFSDLSKAMDTYMDQRNNFYYVDSSFVSNIELGTSIKVSETEFREHMWDNVYTGIETIEYIIIENSTSTGYKELANVECEDDLSGDFMTVYKNLFPGDISIKEKLFLDTADFFENEYVELEDANEILNPNAIVYGPYAYFAAGEYTVTIYGDNLDILTFDVWSSSREEEFELTNIRQSSSKITYTFMLVIS